MCSCACSLSGSLMLKPLISNFCAPTYYPILFIFSRFALSMIFIFFPSIAIIFSWAKAAVTPMQRAISSNISFFIVMIKILNPNHRCQNTP